MYLQIKRFDTTQWVKNSIKFLRHNIALLWLYNDDWELIKRIKQDEVICDKMKQWKFQVDIPDIQHLLTEKDAEVISKKAYDKLCKENGWQSLFNIKM